MGKPPLTGTNAREGVWVSPSGPEVPGQRVRNRRDGTEGLPRSPGWRDPGAAGRERGTGPRTGEPGSREWSRDHTPPRGRCGWVRGGAPCYSRRPDPPPGSGPSRPAAPGEGATQTPNETRGQREDRMASVGEGTRPAPPFTGGERRDITLSLSLRQGGSLRGRRGTASYQMKVRLYFTMRVRPAVRGRNSRSRGSRLVFQPSLYTTQRSVPSRKW